MLNRMLHKQMKGINAVFAYKIFKKIQLLHISTVVINFIEIASMNG